MNSMSVSLRCLVLTFAAAVVATAATVEERVRDLVGRMTLEEKVGQLVQYSSRDDMTGPASASSITPLLRAGGIGSMLNVTGVEGTRKWQKLAVESSRLHVPLLFGLDVIHGYRTTFPIPLATAASWDLERIEHAERIAATEAAAVGVHWTFAPMVDIARDPRWGRIAESAGEDPFLGGAIARARVRGFQGTDLAAPDTILACAKHFAAYGAAQAGRDYFTTDVTERTLREVYLPPFHAAVDAGVGTLMAAFNDLDGTPCSANAFLLDRVLRGEWGFRGFVVSDWAGIAEMHEHGTAADLRDAASQAFRAGVDMDMESEAYGPHLAGLVRAGVVSEARLDAAVGAVLAAKARLGLLDDPYRYCDEAREKATLLRPDFLAAARDLGMADQIVIKQNLWNAERIAEAKQIVDRIGSGVIFMPIIADDAVREAGFLEAATHALSADAVELIHWHAAGQPMTGDGGPLFSARARAVATRGDWHLWVNTYAIVNKAGGMLSGGRGDELAVAASFPRETFGFWAERGATMIQTDEPGVAIEWLTSNGYRRPYADEPAPVSIGMAAAD